MSLSISSCMGSSGIVSVIIPCGRPHRLGPTLLALLNQTYEKDRIEFIIVTPQGQSLPPYGGKSKAGLKVVHTNDLYPPGKMRNIGALNACGEYLFFIDDDCIPPPSWINKMLTSVGECPGIGAVGCRVISMKKGFWHRCADFALFADYQHTRRSYANLGSAALCVRADAFHSVNGFDENLKASEDWDFSLKLRQKKWLCLFEPSVEIAHDHRRQDCRAILKSCYRSGKLSGLCVQHRHHKMISWLARISLFAHKHHFYVAMVLPYAVAITVQQFLHLRYSGFETRFLPIVFLSKIAYHMGVLSSGKEQEVCHSMPQMNRTT